MRFSSEELKSLRLFLFAKITGVIVYLSGN
nr:MAG TPA: hypothetical protein [Caudoviricetes sp.]